MKNSVEEMENNHLDTEVLIVGSGLTGLTLACDLLRRGIDFRIIEKQPDYFPGSRGKGLTPRSLEIMEDLNLLDSLLPYGYTHPVVRYYDGPNIIKDEDLHAGMVPTPDIPYPAPLWMPQFQIEHTMRDQLAKGGKHVELATELTYIEQNEEEVTATVQKNGEVQTIKCRYLVAADGGRSFVRKFLQVGFAGETREAIHILVGDVHADTLDHEHTHIWRKHPDGFIALTPFAKMDIFQFSAQVEPDFNAEPTLELFQQILDQRTGMHIKLSDPTWLSSFKVNIRMVDHSIIGRIFIAGDAAHVHSPTGGQGMNTGIQDAYNLGWKLGLVLRGTNARLLETYQEERLPVAASVLKMTTQLLEKFVSADRSLPSDPDRLQLNLNYRQSSLSKQATSLPLPVQAGDRAPDAPLKDSTGNTVRLFKLLSGTHFSLLSTGEIPANALSELTSQYTATIKYYQITDLPTASTANSFSDVEGHFHAAYGQQSQMIYLIRPDGYIGFIGEISGFRQLLDYLKQVLG